LSRARWCAARTTRTNRQTPTKLHVSAVIVLLALAAPAFTQTRAEILRGEYGRYRANNDLLSYRLDIRVDPARQFLTGKNTIRFRMLSDDTRVQMDLYAFWTIERIVMGRTALNYTREMNAVFIDFPEPLRAGRTYAIDFYYSGTPEPTARFGCITFRKDSAGRDWITTACEDAGASYWWPNKDQWRDEVDDMQISVAVPNQLTAVSNGAFAGTMALPDGYTRWNWVVHYPINSYGVALNIGAYERLRDRLGDLALDYYVLPEDVARAKEQFAQVKPMLQAFEHYFGEYPFKQDGYKLVQVPYAGMEHQSAVAYGNHFVNSYYPSPDWTGVQISPRFDFIIIHESAHEWFGNAVTAADVSDMWIHEGWATYLECLFVEYMYGHADYLAYVNAEKNKVRNIEPILTKRGIHQEPTQDQYFKGALFLHTLRSIIDDDRRWFALIREMYQRFTYTTILTEDIVQFFNQQTGMNLTPVFDEYLRHPEVPMLQLKFDETAHTVNYRWKASEKDFAMPVRVGDPNVWQVIRPTSEWQMMRWPGKPSDFEVATELYYVYVDRQ
jgi:aminopeptidase N